MGRIAGWWSIVGRIAGWWSVLGGLLVDGLAWEGLLVDGLSWEGLLDGGLSWEGQLVDGLWTERVVLQVSLGECLKKWRFQFSPSYLVMGNGGVTALHRPCARQVV